MPSLSFQPSRVASTETPGDAAHLTPLNATVTKQGRGALSILGGAVCALKQDPTPPEATRYTQGTPSDEGLPTEIQAGVMRRFHQSRSGSPMKPDRCMKLNYGMLLGGLFAHGYFFMNGVRSPLFDQS